MYRITKSCLLLLAMLFVFSPASRADLGMINIHLKATIIAKGCSVSSGSQEQTVNLGETAIKQLKNNGGKGSPVPFTIILDECDGKENKVKITFSGKKDSIDPTILAITGTNNVAQNVGVAILDKDRNKIVLNAAYTDYKTIVDVKTLVMNFYGQYWITGPNVTTGEANADATFTVDYD